MELSLCSLSFPLLLISAAMVLTALVTEGWECGGLFTGCQYDTWKISASAVAGLMIVALIFLVTCIILEFICLCFNKLLTAPYFILARNILLVIGMLLMLIAVLVYTGRIGHQWSYFLAVCSSILLIQTVLVTIVTTTCFTTDITKTAFQEGE
ncbi:uncharacterized protein DEA37_0001434 [Paragonimus westermani]|uniref:Uncharacterized protein n=1 Tax=Paragonimus westermani TaxID=34504 RepID=A0A5J4NN98_9TREM|nr:uncharacterized protein DEA37_0001434 [Paragonimus westermani]